MLALKLKSIPIKIQILSTYKNNIVHINKLLSTLKKLCYFAQVTKSIIKNTIKINIYYHFKIYLLHTNIKII